MWQRTAQRTVTMHWCVPALTDRLGEVASSIAVNLNLRFIRPPDEGSEKETSTAGAWCKHLCESGAKFLGNSREWPGFPALIG
jgi:hypothetical protein